MSTQTYGYAHRGMDPRHFRPDTEACTPAEIAAWQKARKQAEAGEPWGDPHPPIEFEGREVLHYSGSAWGIGTKTWPDDGPDGGERLEQTA